MQPEEALRKLSAAFSGKRLTPDTIAIYVEAFSKMREHERDECVRRAIDNCKFMPKVSELWAFAKNRDVGHKPAREGEWDEANQALARAMRETDSPEERFRISERNQARFEAVRRAQDRPVLASSFVDLDAALERHGLDWNGDPLPGRAAESWEVGREVKSHAGGI